jgi:hypothetical protein
MTKRIYIIFLSLSLFCNSTIKAQDTLVGWTFPVGWKNTLSDTTIGNDLNKGGMFIVADSINERPFTPSISLAFNGYHTKSASTVLWDHAKDLKCWKFSCNATGYKNLKIYARVSSDSNNPGPRNFKIQYNLGCCNNTWYDVPGAAHFTVSTDWTTGFVNGIEMPEVADSMAVLNIRFVCTSDTATDGTILKTTSRSLIDEVYVTGDKMTSINDNNPDHSITIYPNPANDYIQIRSQKQIKTYKILDLTGRLLKSQQLNLSEFKINCSDLKPGCYFIDINFDGNGHLVRRVIIE